MKRIWLLLFSSFLVAYGTVALGAKPQKPPAEPAAAAPEIFSVKVDYVNGFVVVEGENLSAGSVTATFAGVSLATDPSSTDSLLLLPFTVELESAVDELGNYVLVLSTDGGSVTLTAFIPLALTIPSEPPPPGPDCPCSTEWDLARSTPSPGGFDGLVPYCSEESSSFATVQFYDVPANNMWVLWTGWNAGSGTGYCELYIDGPDRTLETEEQFTACSTYLSEMVADLGDQGQTCIF